MDIIRQLTLQGLSLILSSHAPNDALSYADRALVLNDGWVLDYGQPREILTEAMISSVYGIQTDVIYSNQDGLKVPRAFVPRLMSRVAPESVFEPGSFLFEVFEKGEDTHQLILVTGLSGAGKTTWCKQLAKLACNQNLSVGGILSPGLYRDGKKVGIGVVDLQSGEERQLAHLHDKEKTSLSTPRWSFNQEVMGWADLILKDLSSPLDLLIIDELGPLEFLRNEGLTSGLELIDKKNYKTACVVVRSSLLPKALQRWPDALVINGTL
jgi:iron complex transport system ATP-binding protein